MTDTLSFYDYPATIVRWVDGDTVDAEVDLGFRMHARLRFRLAGVNTPERGKTNFKEATQHAESICPVGSRCRIRSSKAGKFGRYLAEVWPEADESYAKPISVNDSLLQAGLAVPYDGGRR